MRLSWLRSPQDMRRFISDHVCPGAEPQEWYSDKIECGILLWDACLWHRFDALPDCPVYGPRYRATCCLKSGHWSLATSSSMTLAACIALCRATEIRLTAERENT